MQKEHLRCKTSGCENTPYNIPARVARAIVDYHAPTRPGYVLRISCERCNKTSTYTANEIAGLIPPEKRPQLLPADHFWAYLLIEFKTSRSAEQQTFLSDRVLMQRLYIDPDKSWYGILKSTSPYAPSLKMHSYIKGETWNNYEICRAIVGEGHPKSIPRPEKIARTSSYAIFVADRRVDAGAGVLRCANICCSNPSCKFLYSTITYEKFKKVAVPAPPTMPFYDTATQPVMTLFCELCEMPRIIDEGSFSGLFKGDLSVFKT